MTRADGLGGVGRALEAARDAGRHGDDYGLRRGEAGVPRDERKKIAVAPGAATIRYATPMSGDSPLRGGKAEEVTLGGPVLSTGKSVGLRGFEIRALRPHHSHGICGSGCRIRLPNSLRLVLAKRRARARTRGSRRSCRAASPASGSRRPGTRPGEQARRCGGRCRSGGRDRCRAGPAAGPDNA